MLIVAFVLFLFKCRKRAANDCLTSDTPQELPFTPREQQNERQEMHEDGRPYEKDVRGLYELTDQGLPEMHQPTPLVEMYAS